MKILVTGGAGLTRFVVDSFIFLQNQINFCLKLPTT